MDDMGRELRQTSARITTVLNSYKVKCVSPKTLLNKFFIDFTAASKAPEMWRMGLNKTPGTPTSVNFSCTIFTRCSDRNNW